MTTPVWQNNGVTGTCVSAFMFLYNPATNVMECRRTPTAFHTLQLSGVGPSAVWTPTTGKSFRLMGGSIQLSGNATLGLGGITTLTLLDSAAPIGHAIDLFVPTLSLGILGGAPPIPLMFPDNGYLSSAVNNVLNATLSVALTGGSVRINIVGTEE